MERHALFEMRRGLVDIVPDLFYVQADYLRERVQVRDYIGAVDARCL